MLQALTVSLPNSRTHAVSALALFVAVQLADAVLTYTGVQQFGPRAEANPLLSFCIANCGVAATLITAKLVAVALATALYVRARYLPLALLTVVYVFAAVAPWAFALPL
ncbi:MAG: DUF5658 family protein [Betaproteobacteria bacterium]